MLAVLKKVPLIALTVSLRTRGSKDAHVPPSKTHPFMENDGLFTTRRLARHPEEEEEGKGTWAPLGRLAGRPKPQGRFKRAHRSATTYMLGALQGAQTELVKFATAFWKRYITKRFTTYRL